MLMICGGEKDWKRVGECDEKLYEVWLSKEDVDLVNWKDRTKMTDPN